MKSLKFFFSFSSWKFDEYQVVWIFYCYTNFQNQFREFFQRKLQVKLFFYIFNPFSEFIHVCWFTFQIDSIVLNSINFQWPQFLCIYVQQKIKKVKFWMTDIRCIFIIPQNIFLKQRRVLPYFTIAFKFTQIYFPRCWTMVKSLWIQKKSKVQLKSWYFLHRNFSLL